MKITEENYYSLEANKYYFTCSQIKDFMRCPSMWQAKRLGEYERAGSDDLFYGQYVDSALTEPDNFSMFCQENSDKVYWKSKSKTIQKLNKITQLDIDIERVKRDKYFMKMISGETQVIIALQDFYGHPYKCKLDALNFTDGFLTDLKTCKDINGTEWALAPDGNWVKVSWIDYWKYPMQLSLYREAVYEKFFFRPDPYLAAIQKSTKGKPFTNYNVFDMLDPLPLQREVGRAVNAMDKMSDLSDRSPMDLEKCDRCDWCLSTRVLEGPKEFKYNPKMLEF